LELEFHPKQGLAWKSKSKITLCCSGIQGGKTTVGALWAITQSTYCGKDDNAIIAAPTYKILNQSTLPTFFKFAAGKGTYSKVDSVFKFKNGSTAYIRTSTDPFSVEGITNVKWIWLDEAGMCKYMFWINLEGRAARTGAPIMCTTTPYGINWPYQHLIKPFKSGERTDINYLEWLSVDNPTFPREEYDRQKQILDPRTFRRKYMGMSERMEGLVYELSDDNYAEHLPENIAIRYYAGVDWGFSEGHEFAILVRGITNDGFKYDVHELKAAKMDPQQQVMACKALQKSYNIETFYCDPARPDMIAALNKEGIRAIGFHVGKEAYKPLLPSIQKHYELIKSGRYKIIKENCPNLLDEYETYHWPESKDGKEVKEVPVAVNNHILDAARYITIGTMHVQERAMPREIVSQRYPHIDTWNPKVKSKQKRSWDSY